jgi:hypothetical protein
VNRTNQSCELDWARELAGYYQYNLYDTCNHTGGFRRATSTEEEYRRGRAGGLPTQLTGVHGTVAVPRSPLPSALTNRGYSCSGEQAMRVYFGLARVKAALHVPLNAVFYDSDGMGAQYTYGSTDQRPWYSEVVPQEKMRILIYSGDADTCVNTLWSGGPRHCQRAACERASDGVQLRCLENRRGAGRSGGRRACRGSRRPSPGGAGQWTTSPRWPAT